MILSGPLGRWLSRRRAPPAERLREEEQRAIAGFLAGPRHAAEVPPTLRDMTGLSGVPGMSHALAVQRLALAGNHATAAEAAYRALLAMPEASEDATDEARHRRLCRALAMMLLARCATRANLASVYWTGLGDAATIAGAAIAAEPLLLHLRLEHADMLVQLGRHREAVETLAAAAPLAATAVARMRLAGIAVDAASAAAEPAPLLDRVERDFLQPLLAEGRDDELGLPADDEDKALASWPWYVTFQAGRVAYLRALNAPKRDGATRLLAGLAARRFTRSGALLRTASPAPSDTALAVENWRKASLRFEAQLALALGHPGLAARRLRQADAEGRAQATLLGRWIGAGRPPRLAATTLFGRSGQEEDRYTALALTWGSASWSDTERVARPSLAEPVVVAAGSPLLADHVLANRMISDLAVPSIARLRPWLARRYLIELPVVRLHPDAAPQGTITIVVDGKGVLAASVPTKACLLPAAHVAAAGATPLAAPAPRIEGVSYRWVPRASAPSGSLAADFAVIGLLEQAALRHMAARLGIEDTLRILPGLTPTLMPRAVATLRALLAERLPLGLPRITEIVRGRVLAGDAPDAIVAQLRALPGLATQLWGREADREPVMIDEALSQRLVGALDDAKSGTAAIEAVLDRAKAIVAPVLVVARAEHRRPVRDAVAPRCPDLPVLSHAEWIASR